MPRVVQDQKSKYETDELFKKLSQESEVRDSILFKLENYWTLAISIRDGF